MKSAFVVAAILVASSGVAKAGGYLGLGIGPSPGASDAHDYFSGGSRTARFLGGVRFGQFSAEGAITGFALHNTAGTEYDAKEASVSGKFNLPLGDNFEAFGRLGLQRTWLSAQSNNPAADAQGNGYQLALGMEYRLNVGVASGSLFLDYSHHSSSYDGPYKFDLSVRMWMLGVLVEI